ncbi:MAG: hypothetical protein QX198_14815, partial [Methylococcaceae bacterium]
SAMTHGTSFTSSSISMASPRARLIPLSERATTDPSGYRVEPYPIVGTPAGHRYGLARKPSNSRQMSAAIKTA